MYRCILICSLIVPIGILQRDCVFSRKNPGQTESPALYACWFAISQCGTRCNFNVISLSRSRRCPGIDSDLTKF